MARGLVFPHWVLTLALKERKGLWKGTWQACVHMHVGICVSVCVFVRRVCVFAGVCRCVCLCRCVEVEGRVTLQVCCAKGYVLGVQVLVTGYQYGVWEKLWGPER